MSSDSDELLSADFVQRTARVQHGIALDREQATSIALILSAQSETLDGVSSALAFEDEPVRFVQFLRAARQP